MPTIDVDVTSPARRLTAGDAGIVVTSRARRLLAPGSITSVTITSPTRLTTASTNGPVVTAPTRTMTAGATSITLSSPIAIIDIEVIPGTVSDAAPRAQNRSLSASVISGTAISVDVTIPARVLGISFEPNIALVAPPRIMSTAVISGTVAAIQVTAPASTTISDSTITTFASVDISVPVLVLRAAIFTGTTADINVVVPNRYAGSNSPAGTLASIEFVPPGRSIGIAVLGINTIDVRITKPSRRIYIDVNSAISTAYRTWVLNVRKAALTEYNNFAFNTLTIFKGQTLAAGPAGLFNLSSQADDDGSDINASIITGKNDFGTSFNKRIPRIYIGYSTDGDTEFHTITSQDGTRKYLLEHNGISDIQQRRVKIGRGPKSRYWQFGIQNRAGKDFSIESVLVYPEKTSRRII